MHANSNVAARSVTTLKRPPRAPYIQPADPETPYPQLTGQEPCRTGEISAEAWFEEGPGAGYLCRGCPVLSQCAEWALANPQLSAYGVWGGMTARQRASVRRRRTRLAA